MKRLLSLLLALVLVAGLVPLELGAVEWYGSTELPDMTSDAAPDTSRYFYNQLKNSTQRVFYNALVDMYQKGELMKGNAVVELTDKVDSGVLAAQTVGAANLLNDFGAARDAFWLDFPSVFYVDFSAISIRITQSGNDYHLYMGPGRYETYYNGAFNSVDQVTAAQEKYDAALNQLVAQAANYTNIRDKIKAIHDAITKSVTYRDENTLLEMFKAGDTSKEDSLCLIRTAYGALVNHEGVCESYTRAFKAALDKLGIPCVMVYGVYKHGDGDLEQHIWNNVFADGAWYGVDVTMDDPVNKKTQKTSSGLDGYENGQNFMIGHVEMSVHHVPSGIVSESGFEFTYPVMNYDGFGGEIISDENSPLKVRYEVKDVWGEENSGVFYVSYMGMNLTEMMQNGYYLVMKYSVYDVVNGWTDTDWGYVTPELYEGAFPDIGHETEFKMPHIEYVEFGVTETPYPPIQFNVLTDLYYRGDPSLLLADSGMIHNENGTYRAAPFVKKVTPSQSGVWTIDGQWKHVVAEYDDILVTQEVYDKYCKTENHDAPEYLEELQKANAQTEGVRLKTIMTDWGQGIHRELDYSHLTKNFVMYHVIPKDGDEHETAHTVIEFDFRPSDMWADDNVFYSFTVEGLVGAWSGKQTNYFGYGCSHPCALYCWRSSGFDYNCFAKPQMISDTDLSALDLDDAVRGTKFEDEYKQRLMLVVEDANKKDEHQMNEMIEKDEGDEVLSSMSYNINLTLCRVQWEGLADGMSIRITCGFPAGYGPEDAGVTFKAYHYIKDEAGNITGIEEIPCTITPYGLLITVSSFSPFVIAAVKGETDTSEKTVQLIADVGGKISATGEKAGAVTLKKGESVTVNVKADDGYVIDTVEASGVKKDVNHDSFTISYDDIDGVSSIISAKFVVKTVAEKEQGNAVIPSAKKPATPTVSVASTTVTEGGNIALLVNNANEAFAYHWYKSGGNGTSDALVGVGSTVTISGADTSDSGTYYCIAMATGGASVAYSDKSTSVNISVAPKSEQEEHSIHTYGGYISNGETGHHRVCSHVYSNGNPCGFAEKVQPHVFNSEGKCELCEYVNEDLHSHRYSSEYSYDDSGHWQVCAFTYSDGHSCSVATEHVPHVYTSDPGKCDVCGYTNDTGHLHVYSEGEWYYDTENPSFGHYQVCGYIYKDGHVCGAKTEVSPHTPGADGKCTVCGFKKIEEHNHTLVAYNNDTGCGEMCTECDYKTEVKPHNYDPTTGICKNGCGHFNFNAHTVHSYTSSPAVPDGVKGHYFVCDFTHTNENGEVITCTAHSETTAHTYGADGICTVCGFFHFDSHTHSLDTSKWVPDGMNGHYHPCTFKSPTREAGYDCEHKENVQAHQFDANGVCTVCGYHNPELHNHTYEGSSYYPGENGHYRICTYNVDGYVCDHKSDEMPHSYVNGVCSECGAKDSTYGTGSVDKPDDNPTPSPSEHIHSFTPALPFGNVHRRICTICGTILFEEPHRFVNGVCSVCGAREISSGYTQVPDLNGGELETVDVPVEGGTNIEAVETVR